MKKILVMFLLVLSSFAWIGCLDEEKKDDPVAYISFSNVTTDYTISYGIRFGEAEWNGSLAPDANTWDEWGTQGVEIEPGSYSVEMKDASGNWTVVSTGTLTAEKDHVYDVVISGTNPSYSFSLYDWGTVGKSAPQELTIKELKISEIPTNSVKYIEK